MIRIATTLLVLALVCQTATAQHFASGIKIGEVDQTSAIVWARLTKNAKPNFDLLKRGLDQPMPEEIVVGQKGNILLNVSKVDDAGSSPGWIDDATVGPETDFSHQFSVGGLEPDTAYRVTLAARDSKQAGPGGAKAWQSSTFRTAPKSDQAKPIRFIVTTCQAVLSVDSGPDGHAAYEKMLAFEPHFFVHTGDIVYYDKMPLAKTVAQARAKWNLMFSYGHNQRFHQQVPSYFMKDDHDTLKNDCWPGQKYGDITFEQGLSIFREQVPMGDKTWRTVRWGKDVQVWMTENRDFRSPNTMKDGPEKTILGDTQKQWLMDTVAASTATFKFVISPGPIVGPDKKGKADNHANAVFAHEGQQLRDFLASQKRTFVICGDRHWQYCSRDPKTGLIELGCGPINDQHSFGGDPGRHPDYHRYFSHQGGFLGITVDGKSAKAEWFGVNAADGSVLPRAKVLHGEQLGE